MSSLDPQAVILPQNPELTVDTVSITIPENALVDYTPREAPARKPKFNPLPAEAHVAPNPVLGGFKVDAVQRLSLIAVAVCGAVSALALGVALWMVAD